MKRSVTLLLVAIAAGVPVAGVAAQKAKDASALAGAKTLDPAKGYFHQQHIKKLNMTCTNCHSSETQDILFLRKDDVVPPAMPGQVNRSICLSCHTAPSKPAWYGLTR